MSIAKDPHINKIDTVRQFQLGTQFVTTQGARFRYGKILFGIVGKTDCGKILRRIEYRWIPIDRQARQLQLDNPPHCFLEVEVKT